MKRFDYLKIKSNIERACTQNGLSVRKLAEIIGMNEKTMYYRQANPQTYRVDELLFISSALHVCVENLLN